MREVVAVRPGGSGVRAAKSHSGQSPILPSSVIYIGVKAQSDARYIPLIRFG